MRPLRPLRDQHPHLSKNHPSSKSRSTQSHEVTPSTTSFLSTTDYGSFKDTATTAMEPTPGENTTQAIPTAGGDKLPCPDGFTEGESGCLVLLTKEGSYMNALGRCQSLDKGDLLGYPDFKNEFDAVSILMIEQNVPIYRFFVNGYASDLV
ncbi:hypothetical protein PFISCL1PPCAC_9431, partial [Pristionchus fissidentatus]